MCEDTKHTFALCMDKAIGFFMKCTKCGYWYSVTSN